MLKRLIGRVPTRTEDETLLEMIHWRSLGHHPDAIAEFMNLSKSYTRSRTNRFKKELSAEGAGEFTQEAFW
jgi:hypothetical protein